MGKIRLIQQVRDAFASLRTRLRTDRATLIARAISLLDEGLIPDEVYVELREEYIDSIPLIVERGDAAIDWDDIAPGILGDILEAIDGPVIERLLRGIVNTADRRHRRQQAAASLGQYVGTFSDAMARLQGTRTQRRPAAPPASVHDITTTPAVIDDTPSRSAALEVEPSDGWGMSSGIS
jgi:hypothetical protein